MVTDIIVSLCLQYERVEIPEERLRILLHDMTLGDIDNRPKAPRPPQAAFAERSDKIHPISVTVRARGMNAFNCGDALKGIVHQFPFKRQLVFVCHVLKQAPSALSEMRACRDGVFTMVFFNELSEVISFFLFDILIPEFGLGNFLPPPLMGGDGGG